MHNSRLPAVSITSDIGQISVFLHAGEANIERHNADYPSAGSPQLQVLEHCVTLAFSSKRMDAACTDSIAA